jgi:hypothetical protein
MDLAMTTSGAGCQDHVSPLRLAETATRYDYSERFAVIVAMDGTARRAGAYERREIQGLRSGLVCARC